MAHVHTKCPHCGAKVIRDDASRTVAHDEPVCEAFDAEARKGNPEVRTVNPGAVPAHLAALRRRVDAEK